jgi:hypothetical protein
MTRLISTTYGESNYVPDPPRYRRAEINSSLIDTQEMADWISEVVYFDLARLNGSAKVTIEGNPDLRIGQTVRIIDDELGVDKTYFPDVKLKHYWSSTTSAAASTKAGLVLFIGSGNFHPLGLMLSTKKTTNCL